MLACCVLVILLVIFVGTGWYRSVVVAIFVDVERRCLAVFTVVVLFIAVDIECCCSVRCCCCSYC